MNTTKQTVLANLNRKQIASRKRALEHQRFVGGCGVVAYNQIVHDIMACRESLASKQPPLPNPVLK